MVVIFLAECVSENLQNVIPFLNKFQFFESVLFDSFKSFQVFIHTYVSLIGKTVTRPHK